MPQPHFNKGIYSDKVYIFSCPGQKEEASGKPISGNTGSNFDIFLALQHQMPNISRYNFRITNASDQVHYMAKTGNTEPDFTTINTLENKKRLWSEIKDSKEIYVFGENAYNLVKTMKSESSFDFSGKQCFKVRHLSLSSLNRISLPNESHLTSSERNQLRIQKVIQDIQPF